MNESSLFFQGFQLMLVGMGMVFVFLSVLVICTSLLKRLFAEPTVVAIKPKTSPNIQATEEELAAISAAIHLYRSSNFKQ